MCIVVALHGDFASGKILEEDMGPLSDYVDLFPDWQAEGHSWACDFEDDMILLGYSRGGSEIARLCSEISRFSDRVAGALVYEGPNFTEDVPLGEFDVMICWNRLSRPFRDRLRSWTEDSWSVNHDVEVLEGEGLHFRLERGKRPSFRHNWDWETLYEEQVAWILDKKGNTRE